MKKIVLTLLLSLSSFVSFCQVNYETKINVSLLETAIIDSINTLRSLSGLDPFVKNDTVKLVSEKSVQYLCDNGITKNINVVDTLSSLFGENVYSSYNSSVVTRWYIPDIISLENLEKRMANGYMVKYRIDGTEKNLLVNKDSDDQKYSEYIGLTCKICGDFLYVSQILYITKQ